MQHTIIVENIKTQKLPGEYWEATYQISNLLTFRSVGNTEEQAIGRLILIMSRSDL